MKRTLCLSALVAVVCCLLPPECLAFKLTPISEKTRDDIHNMRGNPRTIYLETVETRLLDQYTSPVHEAVTAKIYGCTGDLEQCKDSDKVPHAVVGGVRWNDNPTFRVTSKNVLCRDADQYIDLDNNPTCWLALFYDANKKAHQGVHFSAQSSGTPPALVYRVHFGDMQFLHAMASWDGETAAETEAHIMMWAEFAYKIADSEIQSLSDPITGTVDGMKPLFAKNGFSTRTLFVPTDPEYEDNDLRKFAFGSLLHMVEDSFSMAHVHRDKIAIGAACGDSQIQDFKSPGKIIEFYSYTHQDSSLHGEKDSFTGAQEQLNDTVNVVTVGQKIRSLYESGKKWNEVKPYFECIFDITKPDAVAGPGPFVPPNPDSNPVFAESLSGNSQ